MNLSHLLQECSEILVSDFKIQPIASTYSIYPKEMWNTFLQQTGSSNGCQGVYFPLSQSAHLLEDTELLPVNFFHEYFGHGLFCEYAMAGQEIVRREQMYAHVPSPQAKQDLEQFAQHNYLLYEGFAMWMESYLARTAKHASLFEKKLEGLVHADNRRILDQFLTYEQRFGLFALMAHAGFPKEYNASTLKDLLRKLYPDHFDSIELCLLYGSQKPYADIDLFLVSPVIPSSRNYWLDIYARTPAQFGHDVDMLSIAVTDPLFTGMLVVGTDEQLSVMQQRILATPITEVVITYQHTQADEQARIALLYPPLSEERRIAESYAQSFRANATAFREGRKLWTFRRISC